MKFLDECEVAQKPSFVVGDPDHDPNAGIF